MEFLSLTGKVTRARALEAILTPSVSDEEDSELYVHAEDVDGIDVVTATATQMRITRHRREHNRGRVTLFAPRDSSVAARFVDLLSPLPEHVTLVNDPAVDPPPHYALVPATVVPDSEAISSLGEFALDMCLRARISRRRAGFIAAAAMELSDNALLHGTGAQDQPVIAIACFGRERLVEVAVTDAGTALSDTEDAVELVRAIPGLPIAGERGFLAQILKRGQGAGVEVRVEIMAGTARLRWTAESHRTERHARVPGTTVVVRVGA